MLAPPRRQSLDPPSDHANRAPRIPPGAGPCWRRPAGKAFIPPSGHANRAPRIPPAADPCWRRPAGKALVHRRATPTGGLESHPAPAHVGAAPPAKPYPTVGPHQQGALFSRRTPLPGGPARSPKGPFFPAGLPLFPVGPLLAVLPPHSNRNLVGKAGTKVKNKPFLTIATEN